MIKWIKLSTSIFDDEKIRIIDSMPERDTIFYIWIRLLVLAGKVNDNGLIYINDTMPYNESMLSAIFNRPLSVVEMAMNLFEQLGMIEVSENNKICLINWEKHQSTDKLEKLKEDNQKRVKKHREKQKTLMNVESCNITETLQKHYGNITVMPKKEEGRSKKEEDKNNNISSSENQNDEIEIIKSNSKNERAIKIIELYNSICKNLPKVKIKQKLINFINKKEYADYTLEEFAQAFRNVNNNDYYIKQRYNIVNCLRNIDSKISDEEKDGINTDKEDQVIPDEFEGEIDIVKFEEWKRKNIPKSW